jgi:light-harvesting protein B-800-850 alpha chain
MNNGRIWCVVKPTVGLPLFLGGVAVIALTVHAAVLTHTTWFSDYWKGSSRTRAAAVETPGPVAPAGFTVNVTPVAAGSAQGAAFVVTVTPTAPAVPAVLAAAEPR